MKALQIQEYGPLERLTVRDVADPELPRGSVRIKVEAAGVNPSDTGIALGRFPKATLPRILGRDYAGTVVEGPAEALGMPVWGSGGGELGITSDGSHAEHLIVPYDAVIRRPARLSAEQASIAGVPFVTAWHALAELAEFRAGETALISGAAGAVGSAALQLADALGGKAIALVRSSDDLRPLDGIATLGIVRSDRDDVPQAVADLTSGRGADVALNGIGAPVFEALASSLGEGGRMVIYSARAGRDASFDLFRFYRRRLRFLGLDTVALTLARVAQIYAGFSPFFESGAVRPSPISARFPLSKARDAYLCVDKGSGGKVLLAPD